MAKLNRKEYKQTIKKFRKQEPLAQIQHKWVMFTDKYSEPVLMFVHNSIIKRSNGYYDDRHAFDYKGYKFLIELYGSPSIHCKYNGITVERWMKRTVEIYDPNKWESYKIIETEEEVNNIYNTLFELQKRRFNYQFTNKKQFNNDKIGSSKGVQETA